MGAANAVAVYTRWAGKLTATDMQILVYMALVSRDTDAEPWFSMRHEDLIRQARGREPGESELRAVRRSVQRLAAAGALIVERRQERTQGGSRAPRYRLVLTPGGSSGGAEPPQRIDEPLVDNPVENPMWNQDSGHQCPAKADTSVRLPASSRTPVSAKRVLTLYKEDYYLMRSDLQRTTKSFTHRNSLVAGARATGSEDFQIDCPQCGVMLDPDRTCRNRTCSAAAVVVPLRRRPA